MGKHALNGLLDGALGRRGEEVTEAVAVRPPGRPEWRYAIFWSSFLPVRATLSALMMMT